MTITPMTKEAAQEWIEALEGPYADKKGKGMLCDFGRFCCLGVKAELEGAWDNENEAGRTLGGCLLMPAEEIVNKWGVTYSQSQSLANLNDKSNTFAPVIAEIKRMFIDGAES